MYQTLKTSKKFERATLQEADLVRLETSDSLKSSIFNQNEIEVQADQAILSKTVFDEDDSMVTTFRTSTNPIFQSLNESNRIRKVSSNILS